MSQAIKTFKSIPQTTLRRLRNTPSYFFLIWRWAAWLYALITIASIRGLPNPPLATLLLAITFLQSMIVTLYAPVFRIFLPTLPWAKKIRQPGQNRSTRSNRLWRHSRPRPLAVDEDANIPSPLARTRNPYWDIAIYGLDVLICGAVLYFSGYFGQPPWGDGSPFYRYGISTALAAALTYRYAGGLTAALGYELFILLGAFLPPPGTPHYPLYARDLAGSLIDTPIIAILAAYLSSLLDSYTRNKRHEQDNVRQQKALRQVGETLMKNAGDSYSLLRQSAEQIRRGGHFERLVIALIRRDRSQESNADFDDDFDDEYHSPFDLYIESGFLESDIPDQSRALSEQVRAAGKKLITFEQLKKVKSQEPDARGVARLYMPFIQDGRVMMVLGAESVRSTPFESKQEGFLSITGAQLVVAIENIRLTEQTVELAAAAERGRIAREIHDGVAQAVYMLSLNTETCAAMAHRIAEASEEDEEMLVPLAERLDKMVTISKQALWETRHYMFTLKPLIRGTSTLTQMLTSQLHEFETISGLPVQVSVEGSEEGSNGNQHRNHKMAQVGTAIFRITQEALTNAYKHAEATELHVHLRYLPERVEVEICDNGKGLDHSSEIGDFTTLRLYSGHGMRGMQERAEELGGTLMVNPVATGGLSIQASIPV